MQFIKYTLTVPILFLSLFIVLIKPCYSGISLSGTSGLINIPVAEVIEDKKVTIGMGMVDKHAAYLQKNINDNYPFYITVGYLPRLEFSAGVVFVPGFESYDGTNTYKDGIVSLQYLLKKEDEFFPSIVIGARDIYSFILLNTSYIAATKTIYKQSTLLCRLHAGYGSDIINQHLGVPKRDRDYPVGHTIVGMFGGLDLQWNNFLTYMLEYDSDKMNTGVRMNITRFLHLEIDILDWKYPGGWFNVSFSL